MKGEGASMKRHRDGSNCKADRRGTGCEREVGERARLDRWLLVVVQLGRNGPAAIGKTIQDATRVADNGGAGGADADDTGKARCRIDVGVG